jgi:hypothetical protein
MAIQEEYASVLSQRAESDLRACVTLAEDPEILAELRRRTDPDQMARDLSEDARRRGL